VRSGDSTYVIVFDADVGHNSARRIAVRTKSMVQQGGGEKLKVVKAGSGEKLVHPGGSLVARGGSLVAINEAKGKR
jgi:hypothetical protein